MLLQAGTLILYLLTTQVTDALACSEKKNTDTQLIEVSKLSDIEKTLFEEICYWLPDQTTCIKGQPHQNGTERFTLWGNTTALCDTTTDEGGWVNIQRRVNNDTDFYRGWDEYKNFFGDLDTNFWLGNDAINRLTSEGYRELRIDLIYEGKPYYAHYSNFSVANESMSYQLSLSGYSGTAGDSFSLHNNMYFSTFDRDNDTHYFNCADEYHGAWWYNSCHFSNLNGLWGAQTNSGLLWQSLTGWGQSVSFSEMKLRRG